jgi:hypothetical protein
MLIGVMTADLGVGGEVGGEVLVCGWRGGGGAGKGKGKKGAVLGQGMRGINTYTKQPRKLLVPFCSPPQLCY